MRGIIKAVAKSVLNVFKSQNHCHWTECLQVHNVPDSIRVLKMERQCSELVWIAARVWWGGERQNAFDIIKPLSTFAPRRHTGAYASLHFIVTHRPRMTTTQYSTSQRSETAYNDVSRFTAWLRRGLTLCGEVPVVSRRQTPWTGGDTGAVSYSVDIAKAIPLFDVVRCSLTIYRVAEKKVSHSEELSLNRKKPTARLHFFIKF